MKLELSLWFVLVFIGIVTLVAIVPRLRRLIRRIEVGGVGIEYHPPNDLRIDAIADHTARDGSQGRTTADQAADDSPLPIIRPRGIPDEADQLEFMSDEYVAFLLAHVMKHRNAEDTCTIRDGSKGPNP